MWSIIATWPNALEGAKRGAELLKGGASAMDAVVQAAMVVEDDPANDTVGYGGFPNWDGDVELDAAVMDGGTLSIGAVAAMRGIKHPIEVARDVMLYSGHNMLAGTGAEAFAVERGYQKETLLTEHSIGKWREAREKVGTRPFGHDTVGIVALANGNIVVGTSTSGIALKRPGRVGDSPIPCCGYYADNGVGGAAATGLGEDIMRSALCFRAVEWMRQGMSPQEAADRAVLAAHEAMAWRGKNPGNIALVVMNMRGEWGGAANHSHFGFSAAREGVDVRLYDVEPIARRESTDTKLEIINNLRLKD